MPDGSKAFIIGNIEEVAVVRGSLVVFGGQYYDQSADLHFECDNQLCVLDVPTLSWVPVPVEGPAPLRRACHGAGVVGKHVYIVGGRYWGVAEDDYIFLNDIQTLDTRPEIAPEDLERERVVTDLRSMTKGRGTFTMEFDRFDVVQ